MLPKNNTKIGIITFLKLCQKVCWNVNCQSKSESEVIERSFWCKETRKSWRRFSLNNSNPRLNKELDERFLLFYKTKFPQLVTQRSKVVRLQKNNFQKKTHFEKSLICARRVWRRTIYKENSHGQNSLCTYIFERNKPASLKANLVRKYDRPSKWQG